MCKIDSSGDVGIVGIPSSASLTPDGASASDCQISPGFLRSLVAYSGCARAGGGEHPENYLGKTPHRSYLVNKPLCLLRIYKHSAQRNHRHIEKHLMLLTALASAQPVTVKTAPLVASKITVRVASIEVPGVLQ